jgi:hypothetical protein
VAVWSGGATTKTDKHAWRLGYPEGHAQTRMNDVVHDIKCRPGGMPPVNESPYAGIGVVPYVNGFRAGLRRGSTLRLVPQQPTR